MKTLYDFYVSFKELNIRDKSFHQNTSNPKITINRVNCRYTETVKHGEKPMSAWNDLKLIGSAYIEDVKM